MHVSTCNPPHRPSLEHVATRINDSDFAVCESGTLFSFCIAWPCCEAFSKTHFHQFRDHVLKRAGPCLQTGGCFSVSETSLGCAGESSRVRLSKPPDRFVPGLLQPRRPSSVLSPALTFLVCSALRLWRRTQNLWLRVPWQ